MNKQTKKAKKKPLSQRRLSIAVVILNAVLLTFAIMSCGHYIAVYQQRLKEENLENIANLNQSSAIIATALISGWDNKLEDIALYLESHSITQQEALTLIEQSNANEQRQIELIGSDYTGYLARRDESGGFIPLDYKYGAYRDLHKCFDDSSDEAYGDICFAPEFTDSASALKCFAIYRHVKLSSESGGTETQTLMLATRSDALLADLNRQDDFEGQSTVLIEASGNYLVSSEDFKSDNFFRYLYNYNDLTLDERNAIEREVSEKGSGELYYKDVDDRDCVFRYERMTTNNWFCVTSVPISSFRTPALNAKFGIYAIIALLVILVSDVAFMQLINRRLRLSVLREKEASEAKTEFLSRMSHDIRTPLNGIIGLTSLALDEETEPRQRDYLENIRVSGQFLSGLVNDILDLSKVESGRVELSLEPYSSADLCKYIEAVVTPLCAEKKQTFIRPEPDNEPPILLDRLRFNQILFNLLSNAVKYTPEGGRVELLRKRQTLRDGRAALELTIKDNGIGMSEEFQKHMFETFSQERAQTANTGSGLGLAIVKSLVKLMDGELSVISRQGEGSAFTVRLQADVCEETAESDLFTAQASLTGRRALLCEDNRVNIMVAQKMLEKWGMNVTLAENGKLGLEAFEASGVGELDIVLMDIMMPVMDGLECAKAIRALPRPDAAKVPILAMTANAYDTDVRRCLEAGMNAHIGKPIDMDQLQKLLSELIGGTET